MSLPTKISSSSSRISVVEGLRGLASISVAVFHFSGSLSSETVRALSAFTALGVDVFFVISGFVIPLSIYGRGYQLGHFPSFMLRRLVRLEPPYLATIAMVIVLGHISTIMPGFQGGSWNYSLGQVASHFLYIVPLTEHKWLQPIYWSLAYEFAFYIFVGLLFPFLIDRRIEWTVLVAAVICGLISLMKGAFDVRILQFIVGVLLMRFVVEKRDRASTAVWLATAVALVFWTGGLLFGAKVAFTVVAILLWRNVEFGRWAYFLGGLSYSLYLIHVPIGGRVVNLGRRFGDGPLYDLALITVALIISIVFAVYFARFIERPAIQLSRKIKLPRSVPQLS